MADVSVRSRLLRRTAERGHNLTSSESPRLALRRTDCPSAAGMFHTPSVICREDDLCRSSGGRSGGGGRAHRHRIDKYLDTLLANQPISDGEDTDHCQKGAP